MVYYDFKNTNLILVIWIENVEHKNLQKIVRLLYLIDYMQDEIH